MSDLPSETLEAVLAGSYEGLPELIATLRIARAWSQEDLAREMTLRGRLRQEFSGRRIHDYETGTLPTGVRHRALREALGIDRDRKLAQLWLEVYREEKERQKSRRAEQSYRKRLENEAKGTPNASGTIVSNSAGNLHLGALGVLDVLYTHVRQSPGTYIHLPRAELATHVAEQPYYATLLSSAAQRFIDAASDGDRIAALELGVTLGWPAAVDYLNVNKGEKSASTFILLLRHENDNLMVQGALMLASLHGFFIESEKSVEDVLRPAIDELLEQLLSPGVRRLAAAAAICALCHGENMDVVGYPLTEEQLGRLSLELAQPVEEDLFFWWCSLAVGKQHRPPNYPKYFFEWNDFLEGKRPTVSLFRTIDEEDVPFTLWKGSSDGGDRQRVLFARALLYGRLGFINGANPHTYGEIVRSEHCGFNIRIEASVYLGMSDYAESRSVLINLIREGKTPLVREIGRVVVATTSGLYDLVALFWIAMENEGFDVFRFARAVRYYREKRWRLRMWWGAVTSGRPTLKTALSVEVTRSTTRGLIWREKLDDILDILRRR